MVHAFRFCCNGPQWKDVYLGLKNEIEFLPEVSFDHGIYQIQHEYKPRTIISQFNWKINNNIILAIILLLYSNVFYFSLFLYVV